VFRLIFWGKSQPKTHRAPEVAWPMALPMVTLTILTLLLPLMLQQWYLLPSWESLDGYIVASLFASTLTGVGFGSTIHLHKAWSRSRILIWRFLQDLLGYDFYIDRIYRLTIVSAVALLSKISAWSDRFLVDGLVNLVGFAAIFSGQSLK
ncbi:MAG: NAD(P)H-quinone oxidoreductase subunit F, partial [Dolichospermum sp.]